MSLRQFSRAFRAQTGTTPARVVERLRADLARGRNDLAEADRGSSMSEGAVAHTARIRCAQSSGLNIFLSPFHASGYRPSNNSNLEA